MENDQQNLLFLQLYELIVLYNGYLEMLNSPS